MKSLLLPLRPATAGIPRAVRLLREGWLLLQSAERRTVTQLAFAQHLGLSASTLADWLSGATEPAQIEAFLRLLERLPQREREAFQSHFLRVYPTLESPRLAHDPLAVFELRALLGESAGLTFIQSPRVDLCSYVLTALAHEASRVGSGNRDVAGVDLYSAEAYVPASGMLYPGPQLDRAELPRQTRLLLKAASSRLPLLFNGVWCQLPELRTEILSASAQVHIILADRMPIEPAVPGGQTAKGLAKRHVQVWDLDANRIGVEFLRVTQVQSGKPV